MFHGDQIKPLHVCQRLVDRGIRSPIDELVQLTKYLLPDVLVHHTLLHFLLGENHGVHCLILEGTLEVEKEINELSFSSNKIIKGTEAGESIGSHNEGTAGGEYFGLATDIVVSVQHF